MIDSLFKRLAGIANPWIPAPVKVIWAKRRIIAVICAALAIAYLGWLADSRGDERDKLKLEVKDYKEKIAGWEKWHGLTVGELERKNDNDQDRADFEAKAAALIAKDRAHAVQPSGSVLYRGMELVRKRQADDKTRYPE